MNLNAIMIQNRTNTLTTPDQPDMAGIHHQLFGLHKKGILVMLGFIFVQFFFMGYVVDAGELTLKALLNCTNAIRMAYEPTQLVSNDKLNAAAESKLQDMDQYKYWAHQNPVTGAQPWDFIDKAGYNYNTAGENLAYGFTDSQKICDAWKKSPKHLANIKDPTFEEVGFAVDKANLHQNEKGILVVQMFGSRSDFSATASQNSQTQAQTQTNSAAQNGSDSQITSHAAAGESQEKINPQVEGSSTDSQEDSVYAATSFVPVFLIAAIPYVAGFSLITTIFAAMQISKFKKNKKKVKLFKKITLVLAVVTVILLICFALFPTV